MSFDESGYILYPRTSQTQQVPAYNFQVSIPGWRSSVPKHPNIPNDTRSRGVPRRSTEAKTVVARNGTIWPIFSETGERFNRQRRKIPTAYATPAKVGARLSYVAHL